MATYRKKLIEVALPLEAINAACKADKDRKTGTIRNLHKWFAPMPLPALRALIFAALVDDPGDSAQRQRLLSVIERLVADGPVAPDASVLADARRLIMSDVPSDLTVFDPFCGGGSTIIEAQRLGLRTTGADLNPIPVLITKVLTEYPQKIRMHPSLHSPMINDANGGLRGFLGDVEHYARVVYERAQVELKDVYPRAPNGDQVIAWWWARTVPSPDPRLQGAPSPLVAGWWLSKKRGERVFLQPVVTDGGESLEFEIQTHGEPPAPSKDHCVRSGAPITFSYIRERAAAGELGMRLLAVISEGAHGRQYFAADSAHAASASEATPSEPPIEMLPERALGFRVQGYGITHWEQLFTPRQLLTLETFARLIKDVPSQVQSDGGSEIYAEAIASVLGLCIGKLAQHMSTLVRWLTRDGQSKATSAFGRGDVPMSWDFAEVNPFAGSVGDWMQITKTALRAFEFVAVDAAPAEIAQRDARHAPEFQTKNVLVVTDPPYFDAIGYSDLSDYFYIWIRRALSAIHPDLFATLLAPRTGELVAAPERHENDGAAREYFIDGFKDVFASLSPHIGELPLLIVYAHKEHEVEDEGRVSTGWDAMLNAVYRAGLAIQGTWPIHGTGSARMRGVRSNALATYVLLVCRPRAVDAPIATKREFLEALRAELPEALRTLQEVNVAPVDLAQAAIGPGMAIFTRYSKVLEAEGGSMSIRSALSAINAALDEIQASQDADFDPSTRFAVGWYSQFGFAEGASGEADALARARNTSVSGLEEDGILLARSGKARLLRRDEFPATWDPLTDVRLTIWEVTQHLVYELERGGEHAASELLARVGGVGDVARELAYRLYAIASRKGWTQDAMAYNSLVASWRDIVTQTPETDERQQALEV